jgi:hypothetical protein
MNLTRIPHDHRGAQGGRSASEYAGISAPTISLTASLLRAGGSRRQVDRQVGHGQSVAPPRRERWTNAKPRSKMQESMM